MPEFTCDLARNSLHVAGQAAVAIVSGAKLRLVWMDDEGGGVSIEQPVCTLRHVRRMSRIAIGGAAAATLYRSPTTEDAHDCIQAAYGILNPIYGQSPNPLQRAYQRYIEGLHELIESRIGKYRSEKLFVEDVSDRAIFWSMMIVARHWAGVEAIAERLASWPMIELTHQEAEAIFRKAMKGVPS